MRFYFYTNISFEPWDYNNSVKKGIGGSETSIVEMSWRLARRGHEVTVYARTKKNTIPSWRGTTWLHHSKATFEEPGIWILYRCPDVIDAFIPRRDDQTVWFMWQDWDYGNLTAKRLQAVDKQITLCKTHARYMLRNYPKLDKKKVWISSNGIKGDLIDSLSKEKIQRNPLRIMHASSPDRGLKQAIMIFKKAREYVPDLELHAFYGFDNLFKITKKAPRSRLAKQAQDILDLIKTTPGVTFHGRVSQPDLYREWMKSGIYVYITDFFETSNIASMEAQAMGAVPVFSPIYAQGENIKHGIGIEGKSEDPLTIARAAAEIVRLAEQPELQEKIRLEMQSWAKERFDWENFVFQWECEAFGDRRQFELQYDFPEQL